MGCLLRPGCPTGPPRTPPGPAAGLPPGPATLFDGLHCIPSAHVTPPPLHPPPPLPCPPCSASRQLALLLTTQQASSLVRAKGGPAWLADKLEGLGGGAEARGVQMPPPLE